LDSSSRVHARYWPLLTAFSWSRTTSARLGSRSCTISGPPRWLVEAMPSRCAVWSEMTTVGWVTPG
jgi:hypothetical protein